MRRKEKMLTKCNNTKTGVGFALNCYVTYEVTTKKKKRIFESFDNYFSFLPHFMALQRNGRSEGYASNHNPSPFLSKIIKRDTWMKEASRPINSPKDLRQLCYVISRITLFSWTTFWSLCFSVPFPFLFFFFLRDKLKAWKHHLRFEIVVVPYLQFNN